MVSASISSFTSMVPISAAKAAPVRPAMIMAAIMAPISRSIPIATRSATKISAPNWVSCTPPMKARMTPTRTLIRAVIGSARTPASASASVRSTRRSRARPRASAPSASAVSPMKSSTSSKAGPGLLGPEPQPLEQVRMPGLGRADASTRPFPRQG